MFQTISNIFKRYVLRPNFSTPKVTDSWVTQLYLLVPPFCKPTAGFEWCFQNFSEFWVTSHYWGITPLPHHLLLLPAIPPSSVVTPPYPYHLLLPRYTPSSVATPYLLYPIILLLPTFPCWLKHGYELACGTVCMKGGPLKTSTAGTSFFAKVYKEVIPKRACFLGFFWILNCF